MKVLCFCIFFLYVSKGYGQFDDINFNPNVKEYYSFMNKGINYDIEGKPDSAIYYCLKAINCMTPFNEDVFFISHCFHKIKDYNNAVKYYYEAVKLGYLPLNDDYAPYYMIENDTIKEYTFVLKQLDSLKVYPTCKVDFEFSNLLYKLYCKDQLSRLSHKFFEQDSLTRRESNRLGIAYINEIDKQNLSELLSYINKKGIAHYNNITPDSRYALTVLIRHYIPLINSSLNKEFYVKIKTSIENGLIPNTKIRMAIDYYYINKTGNKFQFFGTFTKLNKDEKREVSPQIDSIEMVDMRRAKWMFLSLEQQLKQSYKDNYLLPMGYLTK